MNGLTRWAPASDLLRQRFGRVFDDLLGDLPTYRGSEGVSGGSWIPPVDIRETTDGVEITTELPGLTKSDVDISLEDNVLTLAGERRFDNAENQDSYHRVERAYGKFSRSFSLPGNVERDKVKASFKDGVLTVVLPKVEEAKPRKISIS